jgi:serine/threonine protein kinase
MKYCPTCKLKYEDGIFFCPADGEVLEDDPSSIVNTVLDGQYQIESLLGKGGMGAVFLARHILLGDRVAIKVLPPKMRNNAEWLRRFRREGQAARRFRHANAVTVYDLRTAGDGTIYMVMEYVEGHTLDAELRARGRFTPAEAVSALDPIMSVLNEAHAMGVVHRDLKPENIMFGKAGTGGVSQVKLLDLGIAKLREVAGVGEGGSTALTMAGQMLGTPYYMSPEQWGELPLDGDSEIDGRADIYSLGLVFYEMIAGCRPYSAATLLELRKEHVSVTPRHLSDVVADVPRAFGDVIARAMAKDRRDRPATAGELAAELKAVSVTEGGLSNFVPSGARSAESLSQAPTIAIGKAAETVSEVNAATVVGMDATPAERSSATVPVGRSTARVSPPASASAPTITESADMASSITVPSAPKRSPAGQTSPPDASPAVATPARVWESAPPSPRGSKSLVIGGVVALILIVGSIGGFFLIKSLRAGSAAGNGSGVSGGSGSGTTPTTREAMRYWLEVTAKATDAKSVRVAPMIPIASGQLLRFHFMPSDDGFLYLIGPGERNEPTAFLTATPAPDSGTTSNAVKKGVEFTFPSEQWLQLDKNSGSEYYTFIFSTTPLVSPQFFAQVATGHPLSSTEQLELTAFLAKYKRNSTVTETSTDAAGEPFGAVKVPVATAGGNPLVFELRIEHR